MNVFKSIAGSIRAVRERRELRKQQAELDRLKQHLEKREAIVLPIYKKTVVKDQKKDGGHLRTYANVLKRCKDLGEKRTQATGTQEEPELIRRELAAIRFAIEEIEKAADHIAIPAAERALKLSEEISKEVKQIWDDGKR